MSNITCGYDQISIIDCNLKPYLSICFPLIYMEVIFDHPDINLNVINN